MTCEVDETTGMLYQRQRLPQERQDSCYIQLALSRPWENSLGLGSSSQGSAFSLGMDVKTDAANHGQRPWAQCNSPRSSAEADKTGYAAAAHP